MKSLLLKISILFLFSFIGAACVAQSFKTSSQYVSAITKKQKKIVRLYLKYAHTISCNSSQKKQTRSYNKLLATVAQSKKGIFALPVFKGDTVYQEAAISFTDTYLNTLDDEYKNIYSKKNAAYSYDEMKAFLITKEAAYQKLKNANIQLHALTVKYDSTQANRSLGLDKAIKRTDKADTVYNLLYLHFFRNYLDETGGYNAINNKDGNGIQRFKDSLTKHSQEGLALIDTPYAYQFSGSLKHLYKHTLKLYLNEAKVKVPVVQDYLLQHDILKSLKQAAEANPAKEYKEYAVAIKKYNRALSRYNKTMHRIIKNRKYIVQKWRLK